MPERDHLVAHVRPVRKNLVGFRIELQDSLACGDRAAVRYTPHADMRRGRQVRTEVHAFVEFAADGRIHRVHKLTHDVSPNSAEEPAERAQ